MTGEPPAHPHRSEFTGLAGRIDSFAAKVETGLYVLLLSLLVVFSFADVILGRFFDAGIEWIGRFFGLAMLWLAVGGAALATREGTHVTVDAASRFLPPKIRGAAAVLTNLLAAVICAILAVSSARFVFGTEREWGNELFRGFIPIMEWQVHAIIPLGFTVTGLRFLPKIWTGYLVARGKLGVAELTSGEMALLEAEERIDAGEEP